MQICNKKLHIKSLLSKIRYKILRFFLGNNFDFNNSAAGLSKTDITNIENRIRDHINWSSERMFNAFLRTYPKATLTTVVVSLVEHCNLGCWGCDHFAPLAEESFLSIDIFSRDMKRLSLLSESGGGNVGTIKLMGGEPLLHPHKEMFFKVCRNYFPYSKIELVTNGVLLSKQKDDFWTSCCQNNINIVATKYPLSIDWKSLFQKMSDEGVTFNFYGNEELKTSCHMPFDEKGVLDTARMFMHCYHANNCRELVDGKMYTCTVRAHARHFNKFFNKNLILREKDAIDIYKVDDMREVLQFLAHPIPFCRYCNVVARSWRPWQRSKRDISEWT